MKVHGIDLPLVVGQAYPCGQGEHIQSSPSPTRWHDSSRAVHHGSSSPDHERTVATLRLIWITSIHIRQFMRRYMPTNILLNAIRTRRGLKWGVPAMLLTLPYLYVASLCTALVNGGAPEWLYVVALVCVWNALKFVWIGPVSVGLLVRRRAAESRDAHASRPQRSSAWA